MKNNRIEYHFLKRSIEQFRGDLHQIENLIAKEILSSDESLELMSDLVALKESIESLEDWYLKRK